MNDAKQSATLFDANGKAWVEVSSSVRGRSLLGIMAKCIAVTVPAESIPTWVDQDADECSVSSESCWGEQEDLVGEEIPEWGVLPCPAPAVPPVEDHSTRAAVHHRLPSRRLVLVGGGSQSQNRYSPLAHEAENEDRNHDTIQFDVADTESVVTVPEDGFDEDPAEEDEVISEGCGCPFRDRVRSGGSVPAARRLDFEKGIRSSGWSQLGGGVQRQGVPHEVCSKSSADCIASP